MGTPRFFFVIAVILLLWNLMGVVAFVGEYTMDIDALAKTDPVGARIFAAMPGWLWVVFALAVGSGTLGALALLLRRSAAVPLFVISLAAVIVQFGYTFLATDLIAAKGVLIATAFPALIFVIAIWQLLYARSLKAKGVLK
ncbi:sugar transporter [Sphingobium ummariense]